MVLLLCCHPGSDVRAAHLLLPRVGITGISTLPADDEILCPKAPISPLIVLIEDSFPSALVGLTLLGSMPLLVRRWDLVLLPVRILPPI